MGDILRSQGTVPPSASQQAEVIHAYYRTGVADDGVETWHHTKDPAILVKTPVDELIFIDDPDSGCVVAAFEPRFVSPKVGLSRIHMERVGRVKVLTEAWYMGTDIEEAASLAKEYRVIPIYEASQWWVRHALDQGSAQADQLLQHGCYMRVASMRLRTELVYDPVVTDRRIAAASRPRKLDKPTVISLYEFHRLGYELRNSLLGPLADVPDCDRSGWGGSRRKAVLWLRSLLLLYIYVYGPRSYRRTVAFQAFMKQWKTRGARTWKAFDNNGDGPHHKDLFALFDKECKARKPHTTVLKTRIKRLHLMNLSKERLR